MAKKKTGKTSGKARKKPAVKDLSPKPASSRMVVGGRRAQIST